MSCNPLSSRPLMMAAFGLVLSACNGNGVLTTSAPSGMRSSQSLAQAPLGQVHSRSSGKIQHVVIIVQENRSFNNLFYGFPGATTTTYGYNTSGKKITLQPVGLETTWDLSHDASGFFAGCNGTGSIPGTNCQMNGFDGEWIGCGHPISTLSEWQSAV